MKTVAALSVLLGLLSLSEGGFAAEGQRSESASQQRYLRAVAELAGELNNDISFYGRVVDLDGEPVTDAIVKISVRVAGAQPTEEFKRFELKTDGSGAFVVSAIGDVFGIDEIIREGYQYHYKYTPERNFKSVKPEKRHGPGFEPDKPFIFRIRKLAPPVFVVSHNMTFGKSPGKPSMFDLIKRRWVHDEASIIAMSYSSLDKDWHTDILLAVEGEPGKLRLLLEAPDEESGFAVEKHEFFEMMTEAPSHGYRRRIEIPVKDGASPLMAYVKAQGGLFYSRLIVEFSERSPGRVAVNATAFTNLTGSRALEYIPWVESSYDREVYSDHTRDLVRRADLLSGKPIVMPQRNR